VNISPSEVLDLLQNFNFLSDFREKYPRVYEKFRREEWFKEGSKHLIKKSVNKGEKGYTEWTPGRVALESLNYNTRKDFRTKSPLAYRWALEYGLFGKTIHHLGQVQDRKPAGYWDYEKLKAEAFKYKSKKEFGEKNKGAVSTAKKMGIWDEITAHMQTLGSLYERAVYAWEFPDKSVYVGLTYNLEQRGLAHLDEEGKTQVSKHIKKTKLVPIFKLVSGYVNQEEAQDIEICTIDEYKSQGWKILNVAKGGGLGSCRRRWTDDDIRQEAKKYDNVADFKKFAYSAYVSAQKYGIFDEVTKNMKRKYKVFSDDDLRRIASDYNNKTDFIRNEPEAVAAARLRGLYNELVQDMEKNPYDTSGFVPPTNDEILNLAKSYTDIKTFKTENPRHYQTASKNKILPQVRDVMGLKQITKWNLSNLQELTKDMVSRWELQQTNASAYQSARRQGLLDILFPPSNG
jgi:predicted GIY-YIG superfamily endonuclease